MCVCVCECVCACVSACVCMHLGVQKNERLTRPFHENFLCGPIPRPQLCGKTVLPPSSCAEFYFFMGIITRTCKRAG